MPRGEASDLELTRNQTYIGTHKPWGNAEELFGAEAQSRRRHLWCLGHPGMGKTTLIQNLILQDIYHGAGVAFIDPHGDAAEYILDHIPHNREDDVIYFNPSDRARPMGLNLVEHMPADARPAAAEHLLEALRGIYKESWGIQLERILRNALRAHLCIEESTILGIQKMLTAESARGRHRYRESITRRIDDPVVRGFWKDFETWDKREQQIAVRSVLNRLEQLLSNPVLRNIFAQVRSAVNFRALMDTQKIFIANLSGGRLGETPANLLPRSLCPSF